MMHLHVTVTFLLAAGLPLVMSLSVGPGLLNNHDGIATTMTSRRAFVSSSSIILAAPFITPATSAAAVDERSTVTLRLTSSSDKAGLKLSQVTIGTPPRTVLAVQGVLPNGAADRAGVKEGVILMDYANEQELFQKIKSGPYPLELKFYNLAAGGDAFGDLGKPLVTAKDALEMAKSTSSSGETSSSSSSSSSQMIAQQQQEQYVMRVVKPPPASCQLKSRRGDVMEINYEARVKSATAKDGYYMYDSSFQRGTGLPYQFVLGSGDMIPGVDRGLYEMCPGEVRQLEIPPVLGYGPRASKSFDIPSGSRLYWNVELVAVNSVREGDERDREELEGRAAY